MISISLSLFITLFITVVAYLGGYNAGFSAGKASYKPCDFGRPDPELEKLRKQLKEYRENTHDRPYLFITKELYDRER